VHVVGNPLHLLPDKRVLEARLGADRTGRSFAFQSMLKVITIIRLMQGMSSLHLPMRSAIIRLMRFEPFKTVVGQCV